MEQDLIQSLLKRYNEGQADNNDLTKIDDLLANGLIEITDLHSLDLWQQHIDAIEVPSPPANLDNRFYDMLAQEKKSLASAFSWSTFFSWPVLMPRLAMGLTMLVIGLAAGYFIRPSTSATTASADGGEQIEQLSKQVSDLQEMVMLTLLEKESATERLRAVSLTQEMDQASAKVTHALLETLNNDTNVNVRLAALDALRSYAKDDHVREELIRSIPRQDSPLVQIGLADLMAALQAKSSVTELKKLMENSNTPQDVKNRIRESIQVII